jgi:hypothetical protein
MFKQFVNNRQQSLIVWITCIFWVFSKCFSYKLWHADRLFPLSPPFGFLENIPQEIHLFLLFASIAGIVLSAFFSGNRWILGITIAVDLLSCMLDQNRWHPIEYQCLITALFLFFYRNNPKQFLNYMAFLVCIIYINSGLHKLNGGFLFHVWENMILERLFGFESKNIWIHYSGLLLGVLEVVAGIGLLFFRQKRFFSAILIGMHVFILLLISPTGLNYNPIVWPWNFVMVFIIIALFCTQNPVNISFRNLVSGFNKIPFLFLGILPLFSMVGMYDNFLSFNLYSGRLQQLDICIGNKEAARAYKPYFTHRRTCCDTREVINANLWSLKEMNIAVYPEERVYFDIIRKWKAKNPDAQATFCIYQYPYKPQNITHYK